MKRNEIYLFNEHLLAKQPVLFYLSLDQTSREIQKTLPPSQIYSLSQKVRNAEVQSLASLRVGFVGQRSGG